jgi:apolipoprotein N-acyltransferase
MSQPEKPQENGPEDAVDPAPAPERSVERLAKKPFALKLPVAFALAALSGILYWLAFPGQSEIWPLTFVAFVPLWIALRGQTPKNGLRLGLVTGTTMNVAGFYWLMTMLKTFSGFPAPICFLFVFIVCAYQGGRLALMGWLYARGAQRGWPAAPIFLAAFAASEVLYPLLFPWYYGATVHNAAIFAQAAELGGPIMVGVILAATNLAIAEPILARLEQRNINLAFGALRIHSIDSLIAASPGVRVGLVQGNMGLSEKRVDPREGLRRHQDVTAELKKNGIDFVVWSESAVTFAVPENMKESFMHDRVAQRLGIPAIFGAVLFRVDPDRERWFNTALATDARGNVTSRYDKEFLLAFGEYLPFGDMFPILYKWSPNSGKFSSGTTFDPLIIETSSKKHTVTPLICYEDILPGFANDAVNHSHPEMLVNITNDAWFGNTAEPWEHLALAQSRAIEHRLYLARSTNSGVSAFVDPIGRVVKHSGVTDFSAEGPVHAESIDAEVKWMPGGTLYEKLGNMPWWLVSIASIAAAFVRRKDRANPTKADAATA